MIAFTHLMEYMTDWESTVSGAFMCIDGMIFVISPLIDVYVTNNMDFFIGLSTCLQLFGLSMFLVLRIPDSLKFLLVNGRMKQFWHAIEVVKRYNKPSDEDMKRLKA
jgi:hypothetical protein